MRGKTEQASTSFHGVSKGVTRRDAIMGAGLATLAGATLSLETASADEGQDLEETDASASSSSELPSFEYDVYETDVLIVGAGNAGSAAAWSVAREGLRMMIVNKGPVGHGGSTGMCWAGFTNITDIEPETPLSEMTFAWINKPIGEYLINHQLYRNALDVYKEDGRDYERRVRAVDAINNGLYIVSRDENGEIIPYGGNMAEEQLYRREYDGIAAKGLTTLDETMITDFLISEDGSCCGAMGLHLPTGRLRVIRAKATIVATAGCTTCWGQSANIRPISAASTDNTFDTDMAAYRHGLGIAETEFAQWDCVSLGFSTFYNYNVDAQKASALVDVYGERVFPDDDENVNDRNYFSQRIGEVVVKEGRGNEDGYLFVDTTAVDGYYVNEKTEDLFERFGYEIEGDLIPVGLEMYERGGAPVVDENIMTGINGLFWTRGAGTYGENGGSCLFQNHIFGNYAGIKASEYAESLDETPSFVLSQVQEEFERLTAFRTNEAQDALRPWEIRERITSAFYKGFSTWRMEEDLEEALEELERIQEEDMPRQVISDKAYAWNREWRQAIENENMLTSSLMGIRATLMREESRGGYVRNDFPDQDDENWACMIVCRDEDGQMVLEKHYLPDPVE